MKTKRQLLTVVLLFVLGVVLYVFAVLSTFSLQLFSFSSFVIVVPTLVGGLAILVLGYKSVILFGGVLSLKLVEFVARVTRSRHVVEVIDDEEPRGIRQRIDREAFMFFLPVLVFILSMTLAWDINNLHDDRTSVFHPILHALDVFSKPTSTDPFSYSVDSVLIIIILVAAAGINPSLVLPYFRKFKITGVNRRPFHTNLLFTLVGFVVGLGAILALVGLIYETLWMGKGPYYYHYIIPAMLGLSVHYAIGAFLGRDKAEDMVKKMLEASSRERVVRGAVHIEVAPRKH